MFRRNDIKPNVMYNNANNSALNSLSLESHDDVFVVESSDALPFHMPDPFRQT
jgi:hypothetical protein